MRLVEARLGPWLAGATSGELLLVAVCAGVGEEALFRGVVQAALLGRVPSWAAVGLTALLFGLAHALTATYAVLATLMGAYLGGLQLACDNLLVPILTHALYDLVALHLLLGVKDTPPSSVL
ncbi:MAG: lysostaphin resistance A-like protein [Gemmatimonadales bacterium]